MQNHWLLRVGDGDHFKTSSSYKIWGITSTYSFTKYFLRTAKEGDVLWFVKGNSNGLLIAVATFVRTQSRVLGPLLTLTATNEELGWTKTKGEWDTEIHYKNLYNISECCLESYIKGAGGIRLYNDKCTVNLPEEYKNIVRYSKITLSM